MSKTFPWEHFLISFSMENDEQITQIFFARACGARIGRLKHSMLFLVRGAKMQAFASLNDWRESGF